MEGLVLKSIDYKEKSKLVYLYTSKGIISCKALDVSKSKLGFITTLNVVDFELTDNKLPTVKEYSIKKSFYNLYNDLNKIGIVTPIFDIIYHLENDAPHQRIYPFLIKVLDELIENNTNPYFILSLFLIKMLSVFGIKPELNKCIYCNNTNIINFSLINGGALCANCSSKNIDNYLLYQAFYQLYYDKEFIEIDLNYKKLLDKIYEYYNIHSNFKLKGYHL